MTITVFEEMRRRAMIEFDRLAAEREVELRAELAAAGNSAADIEREIAARRRNVEKERRKVGRHVLSSLNSCGIPLGTPANEWN